MDLPQGICEKLYPLTHFIGYRPPTHDEIPSSLDKPSKNRETRLQRWRKNEYFHLGENVIQTFIGSFTAIALLALMSRGGAFTSHGAPIVVGSFGAEAVLLYAAPHVPLSQPKNIIIGNTMSAAIGMGISKLFALQDGFQVGFEYGHNWAAAALSMSVALAVMQLTYTTHPPGGAAAILAATIPAVFNTGWFYVADILICSLVVLGWALIINNLGERRYPQTWLGPSFVRKENENDGNK